MLAERRALGGVIVRELVLAVFPIDEFRKASQGSLGKVYSDGEGAYRWITVHPGGEGSDGVPVKIRESKTEKGVFHVVAGAGGSLNYLKLTDVKSPQEYRERSAKKKKERKEAEAAKKSAERDRLKGMSEDDREAEMSRRRVADASRKEAHSIHEARKREFVARVAETQGWKKEDWQFDTEKLKAAGVSQHRIDDLERRHFKAVETRALEAVKQAKRRLVLDAEARRAAGIGDVPLEENDPSKVALSDLEESTPTKGKGFKSITKEKSDEEIAGALAETDRDALARDLEGARKAYAEGDGNPEDAARIRSLETDLRAADLVVRAASTTPEQVAKDLDVANGEYKQRVESMQGYAPRLQELRADQTKTGIATPEHEALELQRAQDIAALEGIQTKRDDLSILSGEMAPALKGEKGAIAAKTSTRRYNEILQERGKQAADAYRAGREKFLQKGREYQQEMKLYRETGLIARPNVETKPVNDPKVALELIAMEKALRHEGRALSAADKSEEAIDEAVFGRNMFTGLGPQPSRQAITAAENEVANQVMAKRNQAFLDRVESPEMLLGRGKDFTEEYDKKTLQKALEQHLGDGAYNALNNASLAVAKQSLLSREVVDTLGARGAAELLAWKMRQLEDPSTLREMAKGLGAYHAEKSAGELEDAMREIEDDLDRADELMQAATSPADVEVLMEARNKREEALGDARARAGQTLGEFEATAGLVDALGKSKTDEISVNLGAIGSEASIRQLRALGLDRSDYTIDSDGTNYQATIKASGFEKLVGNVDPERMKLFNDVLSIKKGEHDEPDWKPKGTIVRNSSSFDQQGLEPPSLTNSLRPFQKFGDGGSVADHVNEHIARRAANGEPLDNILEDVNANIMNVPEEHRGDFRKTVDSIFPSRVPLVENGKAVTDEQGRPRFRMAKAADHAAKVDQVVEGYLKHEGLPRTAAINSQEIHADAPETREAITRALAPDPRRMVAFSRTGDLTDQDQRALRNYFDTSVAKGGSHEVATGKDTAKQLESHLAAEPTKETAGLFGGGEKTPEWLDWERKRKELEGTTGAHTGTQGPSWNEYTAAMGGTQKAYEALQDRLKSDFLKDFHQSYTTAHGEPLRLGVQSIAHGELHAGFLDPKKREQLLQQRRDLLDQARSRTGGKYSAGSALERMERMSQAETIERQNQMGLLGATSNVTKEKPPPGSHERYTIGNRAEAQLSSAVADVSKDWRPGQPVSLLKDRRWADPAGAPARLIHQQRTIKTLLRSKRLAGALGTGSGKSAIGIGALSHLIHTPDSGVKRGVFIVPSSVQGQFRGEFAKTVEPGSMRYAADPGLAQQERLAQHKDASLHAVVHTQQSFRDDLVHLLSEHTGATPEEATKRFMGIEGKSEQDKRVARAKLMKEVLDKNGIGYQYMMADEAHALLDREGKPDSVLSKIVQAVSDNTPYYLSASADPAKNDYSEVRSLLDKLHPGGEYGSADEWKRKYGSGTTAAAEAMKREVAPYIYAAEIRGNHKVNRQTISSGNPVTVDLTPTQKAQEAAIHDAFRRLQAARLGGKVDVAAAKVLAPERFAAAPAAEHEAIARKIQQNPNTEHALNRVINLAPRAENAKIQSVVARLKGHDSKKKPVVVFAHNLKAVDELAEALAESGHRVEKITGADSAKDRERKRLNFQPEVGEAKSDVLVVSDAAEAGLQLHRGQRLIQYDRPQTAKSHAQRMGRIDRLGQKSPEIDLEDIVANSDFETRASDRINRKYDLRNVLQDPGELIDDTGVARIFSEARRRAAERTKVAA